VCRSIRTWIDSFFPSSKAQAFLDGLRPLLRRRQEIRLRQGGGSGYSFGEREWGASARRFQP
jgi:hypothetical protein